MHRLGEHFRQEITFAGRQDGIEFGHANLADELTLLHEAILGGDEDEFDGAESFGDGNGDAVAIHSVGISLAIEADGRDDGYDALGNEGLEQFDIDSLNLAGKEMIHALEDAHGVGDDRVGVGGAQVVRSEAFQNFVSEAIGRGESELQSGSIRDAGTVDVARSDSLFLGELANLGASAMDQNDADVQGAEDRDIEQEVRKIFLRNDSAIDAQHEDAVPKAGDVLEYAAKVSWFHGRSVAAAFKAAGAARFLCGTHQSRFLLNMMGVNSKRAAVDTAREKRTPVGDLSLKHNQLETKRVEPYLLGMQSVLQPEFEYYLQNQQELGSRFLGRFIAIKGRTVIGVYDEELEAIRTTGLTHEIGTFLVQKADPDPESCIERFHSRFAFSTQNRLKK